MNKMAYILVIHALKILSWARTFSLVVYFKCKEGTIQMVTPKSIKTRREVTITFSRDPSMDYCWSLNGEPKSGMSIFGGGHSSLLELLQGSVFLISVSKVLGKDSLPASYIEDIESSEQAKRIKFSDGDVATIKAMFPGVPFKDTRKKARGPKDAKK